MTVATPTANLDATDGGKTFTEVWNGNDANSFGITNVALDPLNPNVVYASAFDQGLWRRDAGASQTAFNQVFAPQYLGGGTDRTMFALTVKNENTRIYLTDGTANANGINGATAANFWRTDNANQKAAALLASQGPGATVPNPATHLFPQVYNGWQLLTSKTTSNPYFATDDFCTGQCGTTLSCTRRRACPTGFMCSARTGTASSRAIPRA